MLFHSNGITIHYRRTGGNKPPVVLLHGLMTSGACWSSLAHSLKSDYDVIMPDARGHGKSSSPAHSYRYEHLAADIIGLIDSLALHAPVIIGHSMGGMTAALAASRCSKLILVDPTFLTPELQQEVFQSDIKEQHRQILEGTKEEYLAKRQNGHRPKELIERLAEARFQTSIHAFEILTPPNPDYKLVIQALKVPTLLVIGGPGGVISPLMANELAELNHWLEVVQIPDAGHAIPFDQPDAFADTIKKFLQK